ETEPSIEDEGTLTAWPVALDNMLKSAPKDSIFIPGHGDPVDQTGVTTQRGELAWLAGQVEESIGRGVTLASALEALGTEGAPEWPYSDEYMRTALPIVYGQLERVGHKPRRQLPITSI
ncbi:MAG TPA: hypothetical protein VLR88_06600, partial [Propionibacteriaceae bacterium]|nr:hypothetical protein [Propionibacteriaceae bacterium]